MRKNQMKKLTALFLAVIMLLSFVSCNIGKCIHADSDGDGVCDKCGEKIDPEAIDGAELSAKILSQLEASQTFKADFKLDFNLFGNIYYEVYGSHEPEMAKTATLNSISGEVTLTKREGGFDAKFSLDTTYYVTVNDSSKESKYSHLYAYFIDGVLYTSVNDKIFVRADEANTEKINGFLKTLFAGVEFDPDKTAEMAQELAEKLIEKMNIKSGKGGLASFNGKALSNDFISYVKRLDMDSTTVEKVIDDILALVDKKLTAQTVIAELERVCGLTVNEALTELDARLSEKYNTTLQDIYDDVLANEKIVFVIKTALTESGMSEEQAQAQINILKTVNIRDFVTAADIGNETVYDLIVSAVRGIAVGSGAAADVILPAKEELFAVIREYISLSLGEFETATGLNIFSSVKALEKLTVNSLGASLDLDLTDENEIEKLSFTANANFGLSYDSSVAGKTDELEITARAVFNISSFEKTPEDISLPSGSAAVLDGVQGKKTVIMPGGDVQAVNVTVHTEGIQVIFEILKDDTACLPQKIYYEDVPYSALKGYTLTLVPGYCNGYAEKTVIMTYLPEEGVWVISE